MKLTENCMESRGVRALIDTKASMPLLETLTVDSNGFPPELLEELQECYVDLLVKLEEWDEDDMDDDLEDDEEEEESGDEEDLANAMGKVKITPSDVSILRSMLKNQTRTGTRE